MTIEADTALQVFHLVPQISDLKAFAAPTVTVLAA